MHACLNELVIFETNYCKTKLKNDYIDFYLDCQRLNCDHFGFASILNSLQAQNLAQNIFVASFK